MSQHSIICKAARHYAEEVEESQTLGVYDNDAQLEADRAYNDGEVSGAEDGYVKGAVDAFEKMKLVITSKDSWSTQELNKTIQLFLA